ncbi:MAG: response regulator transcription factor [Pseudomonadota bacterium]
MQLTYGNWKATAKGRRRQGEPEALAPREAECLMALASGQTIKEIARSFGVSPGTVKHSLARIYGRLNVTRGTAAIAEAMRRGWIAPLLVALLVSGINPDAEAMRHRPPVRTRTQVSASRTFSRRDTGSLYA